MNSLYQEVKKRVTQDDSVDKMLASKLASTILVIRMDMSNGWGVAVAQEFYDAIYGFLLKHVRSQYNSCTNKDSWVNSLESIDWTGLEQMLDCMDVHAA